MSKTIKFISIMLLVMLNLYIGYKINDKSTIFRISCDTKKYEFMWESLEQFKESRYERDDSDLSGEVCLSQKLRIIRETRPGHIFKMIFMSFGIYW